MDEIKLHDEMDKLRESLDIRKINRISRFSGAFSVTTLVVLFGLFIYGSIGLNNRTKELQALEKLKQVETKKYKSLQSKVKALEDKKEQLEEELMGTYGLKTDTVESTSMTKVLEKSVSANDALKLMLTKHTPSSDLIIAYYHKTIDEKRIALELSALGYELRQRSALEHMEKKEVNAIWFGSEVPIEDVKITALALLRAGVPIKEIRPYKRSSTDPSYKKNIIEVGASTDLDEKALLTVEQIEKATKFSR